MPGSRPKAPTSPCLISSWSSTTRTRTSAADVSLAGSLGRASVMASSLASRVWSRLQDTPLAGRLPGRLLLVRRRTVSQLTRFGARAADHDGDHRAARLAASYGELGLHEPGA